MLPVTFCVLTIRQVRETGESVCFSREGYIPICAKYNILRGFIASVVVAAACPLWADTSAGLAAFKKGDYPAALREWKAAAQKGQAEAEYDLRLLYAKGLGVPRDLQVAQQWYEAAALQGNSQAEFSLGQMYAQGWGIPPDQAA